MSNSMFHACALTRKEKLWGMGYFLFETLLFARLLQLVNALLPAPLPASEINALFFLLNFGAVALIFRCYLVEQLRALPNVLHAVLGISIVGFLVYWIANFFMAQAILAIDPTFHSINDTAIQGMVQENFGLMLFGTVLLVPVTEECLFRGLLFRGLYDRKPSLAWICSVALFCAVHIIGYIGMYSLKTLLLCFIQYIPAGILLAGAYRLSGSILSPILIHAMVNLLAMLSLR